jgi:hypothetical protein
MFWQHSRKSANFPKFLWDLIVKAVDMKEFVKKKKDETKAGESP